VPLRILLLLTCLGEELFLHQIGEVGGAEKHSSSCSNSGSVITWITAKRALSVLVLKKHTAEFLVVYSLNKIFGGFYRLMFRQIGKCLFILYTPF
jgi:hypothetical protein